MSEKIVMVCGSRDIKEVISGSVENRIYSILNDLIDKEETSKVIHGGAEGVDKITEDWANSNNIKTEVFRPDNDKYSYKRAPIERNKKMIQKADQVIAIWDGNSSGTEYVIENTSDSNLIVKNLGTSLGDFS